jgi:hypothetical protein
MQWKNTQIANLFRNNAKNKIAPDNFGLLNYGSALLKNRHFPILMKKISIHENLDTSFVNLAALVRFLRRRNFVGNIRVELNGYEAEIMLGDENQIKAREHDRIAGRVAEGEEAFQRLMIRAREPGGSIHVYKFVPDTETVEQKIQAAAENANGKPFVQKEILAQVPITNGGERKQENNVQASKNNEGDILPPKNGKALPDNNPLPFELSNRVEEKARQKQLTPQEWQTFMRLTCELLVAIDKSLAAAGLDFTAAFAKARAEISDDYPFLNPSAGVFTYANGRIKMREQTNAKLFAAGINESLRRILEKLGANPKFAEVYRQTAQTILALIHRRKPLYEKFSITPQLEKYLEI